MTTFRHALQSSKVLHDRLNEQYQYLLLEIRQHVLELGLRALLHQALRQLREIQHIHNIM